MKKMFKKLIFIVRHGERKDYVEGIKDDDIVCGEYDAELTENGKEQAFNVGNKLKQFLLENNYINPKIKLYSSPFIRTLMTSKMLIDGLDIKDKEIPINIVNSLSERKNDKWFPEPFEKFLIFLKKPEELHMTCQEFLERELSGIEFIRDLGTELPNVHESLEVCTERFKGSFEKIFEKSFSEEDNDILIIVSHFFAIETFIYLYKDPNETVDYEYCISYAFEYDNYVPKFIDKIYP